MSDRLGTLWRFRHWKADPEGGPPRLIWGSGIGELPGDGLSADSKLLLPKFAGQLWIPNDLTDQGEEDMLTVFYRAAAAPTNFFMRLYNDTPVETDTLATLVNEVVGTGYPGSHTVTRDATGFPTSGLDAGDWRVVTRTVTWTNTGAGAWTAATALILATVTTGTGGRFTVWAMLSQTRTLAVNDSLDASASIKAA